MPPSDAVIAITYRCNARCTMCSIWRSKHRDLLTPAHLARLPRSLRTVNITGGEPFLHPRLPDFISAVRTNLPRSTITISTNALLPDRIRQMLPDLLIRDRRLRIAVSLDGLADAHDRIRGLPGAFDHAIQTIEHLKQARFRGLRLAMTLSQANSDQLLPVAELARKLDLELGIVPAHASAVHFFAAKVASPKLNVLLPQLDVFINQLLRSASPKLWLRAHFAHRVGQYITGSLPPFPCSAADDSFFLQADGTIYPCNVCSPPLGNIIEDDFDRIWFSPSAHAIRRGLRKCDRRCWMVCTARSYYRAHPIKILLWILAHKCRAHSKPLSASSHQG